jgi:hypothetical protein
MMLLTLNHGCNAFHLLNLCVCAGGDGPLSRKGSLLHLVDRSATAAGGRLLRRWLAAPLADRELIADRQDAVQVRAMGIYVVVLGLMVLMRSWFGGRLLRRWLGAPLADRSLIADRQDGAGTCSVAGLSGKLLTRASGNNGPCAEEPVVK